MFSLVGDFAAIAERFMEIYVQHKSGEPLLYNPPHNTWDEVARQYERIIEQTVEL